MYIAKLSNFFCDFLGFRTQWIVSTTFFESVRYSITLMFIKLNGRLKYADCEVYLYITQYPQSSIYMALGQKRPKVAVIDFDVWTFFNHLCVTRKVKLLLKVNSWWKIEMSNIFRHVLMKKSRSLQTYCIFKDF